MPEADTGTGTACLLCGSREQRRPLLVDIVDKRHHVEGQWDFRRCGQCGLVALHPFPDDVGAGYPQDYSQHRVRTPTTGTPARTPTRRWLRRHSLAGLGYPTGGGASGAEPGVLDRLVAAFPAVRVQAQWGSILVPRARPGGRLLDVGCGAGGYLAVMRALGWEVTGVEPDATSRAVARGEGLRVVPSIAEAGFEPGSFDVVALNHVIEHLVDPVAELRSLPAPPRPRRPPGRGHPQLGVPRPPPLPPLLVRPGGAPPPGAVRPPDPAGHGRGGRVPRSSPDPPVPPGRGPRRWRRSWAFSRHTLAPRAVVALGTAVACAAAFVGGGEEIELWATP